MEKKIPLNLINVRVLHVSELKIMKKNSVCLSVCLYVCLYISRFLPGDTITFEESSGSKQNFASVFYVSGLIYCTDTVLAGRVET